MNWPKTLVALNGAFVAWYAYGIGAGTGSEFDGWLLAINVLGALSLLFFTSLEDRP